MFPSYDTLTHDFSRAPLLGNSFDYFVSLIRSDPAQKPPPTFNRV